MPKFGLKCFVGSFVFSLAAVVAATKAYSVLSQNEMQPDINLADIEPQNIELFVHREETDPIYEKYNQLTADNHIPTEETLTLQSESHKEIAADTPQVYASITPATDADDLLYEPTTEQSSLAETISAQATAEDNFVKVEAETSETETVTDDEIKIVDASEAPEFKIPLIHNRTVAAQSVSVANSANAI